MSRIQQA